jgi:hypothetical protein
MHSVVWGLLVPYLYQQDAPAARLVCRDLAAAVDSSGAISSIKVGSQGWDALHAPLSLQHKITSLTATINSAHDWSMMHQFLQQLPQCSSLCCTGTVGGIPALNTVPVASGLLTNILCHMMS